MAEKFQRIARDIGVGFRDGKPVSLLEQFKKVCPFFDAVPCSTLMRS